MSENIDRDAVVRDLQVLVNYSTESIPHDNDDPDPASLEPFRNAVDYLTQRAIEEGDKRGKPFYISRTDSAGRPNLVIGTHETLAPDVAILTHLDVVKCEVDRGTKSRTDYFRLEGDMAFGRGTLDMKYSAAAALAILSTLPKGEDDISVSLMFTSDEEVGSKHGAQVLYKKGYRPALLIVPDGDTSHPWAVSQTAKGLWHFQVAGHFGSGGHAAKPWNGDNAIEKAIRFHQALHACYPDAPPADGSEHITLNLADMGVPRPRNYRRNGNGNGNQDDVAPHNKIPDTAFLKYDARFPSQSSLEKFEQELNRLIDAHIPGATISTDVRYDFYEADLSNPDIQLFRNVVRSILNRDVEPTNTTGNTDAVHFPDVPSLAISAVGGNAHDKGEWVSIDSTMTFIQMLKRFIMAKNDRHHQSQLA